MRWLQPNFFWIQALPVLVMLAWILSERWRRLRLIAFGDPLILGLPWRLGRRIAAVILLLLGLSAASAIPPLPVRDHIQAENRPKLIEIVLDGKFFDRASHDAASALDAAEYQIGALLQMSGSAHFALYRVGDPVDLLVPATSDGQGLLIVLGRLRLERQDSPKVTLSEGVRALATRQEARKDWLRRIVVVSSELPSSPSLSDLPAGVVPSVLWIRLASVDRQMMSSAVLDHGVRWIWGDDTKRLRAFLRSEDLEEPRNTGPLASLTYIQYLAGLGYLALLGEVVLVQYARQEAEGQIVG